MDKTANSQINYRQLVHSQPHPFVIVASDAPNFTILDISESYAVTTGHKRSEIIGESLFEVLTDREGKRPEENDYHRSLKEVVKTGKRTVLPAFRYDMPNKDGLLVQKYWRIVNIPLKDSNGEITAIYQRTEDVTNRKLAEHYMSLLSKASKQFQASLNYKKTLNNIASMVVPDVADWCTIEMLDDEGQLEQVAVAHRDPKKVAWAKRLREQQGSPDMDAPIGFPKVIRTGQPELIPYVSDEMLEQTAKNEEELNLMRSIGFSSVIIVPMKINQRVIGGLTLVSAESQLHYDEYDMKIAQGLADRAALAVYNATLYKSARRELKERERLHDELEAINKSLESRVKERTIQLEKINQGLEREIVRRKKAEQELHEYSQKLASSNQELQDFAYVASHDLQEPLRKIQAFGNLLEGEYKDKLGDGLDYLSRMRSAASRMSVLIEDLLSFSRVATKAQSSRSVKLDRIVEEVAGDLETAIAESNAKVTVGKLPTVKADPTHMRQLFQNLISNAIKFHKPDVKPVIKIDSTVNKDHYKITIKDNGIGFDEKYIDKVFSVFQRLHGRDSYSGTGIGLAVCRKIVERYGGTITAKSRPGSGATFIIKLPKSKKVREEAHGEG